MSKPKKTPAAPKPELPPDVVVGDLKWHPSPTDEEYEAWRKRQNTFHDRLALAGFPQELLYAPTLLFYRTKGVGWVLTTLLISSAPRRGRSRGQSDRYYGIGVKDSKLYTVGSGPHVEAVVNVHLSPENVERLWKYVELYVEGLGDASTVRDRISSRRARGQLYRDQGRTSWLW